MLLTAASADGEEDWSWGSDAPAPGVATFNVSVSPEQPHVSHLLTEEDILVQKTLKEDPLPLEPHATYSVSGGGLLVAGDGGGDLLVAGDGGDGLLVAGDGGDREGRFLGIGEKLCSYGIGINVSRVQDVAVLFTFTAAELSDVIRDKGAVSPNKGVGVTWQASG